jgi:hypothetical protein
VIDAVASGKRAIRGLFSEATEIPWRICRSQLVLYQTILPGISMIGLGGRAWASQAVL